MGHGAMKQKDFHPLVFRLFSIQTVQGKQYIRLRSVTGKAVVRWKTKRRNEWMKRQRRSSGCTEDLPDTGESGETYDAEHDGDPR